MSANPGLGDTVFCWPQNIAAIWMPGEGKTKTLTCAAIVAGITPTEMMLHYFLPDGSNGATRVSLTPSAGPERGRWWPRQTPA